MSSGCEGTLSSQHSDLLRMSDLLALQSNLDIRLLLVAPDERRDRVEQILRPTLHAAREAARVRWRSTSRMNRPDPHSGSEPPD